MKYEDLSSAHAGTLVSQRQRVDGWYARYGKRVIDIVLAVASMPVVLVIGVIIWLANIGSNQSLIFAQPRVGKDGKVFTCFKFQTMVNDAEKVLEELCRNDASVNAEWEEFQKLRNDPRITPIGAFLRKTSLDELPQLLNVILGDMSLVGPRPFMVDQDDMYRKAGGNGYYSLKPGITGPWQVDGRGKTSFLSRVRFDNAYRDSVGLWTDFALIISTLRVVTARSGS